MGSTVREHVYKFPFLWLLLDQWSPKLSYEIRTHLYSFPLQGKVECYIFRGGFVCMPVKEILCFKWEGTKDSPNYQVVFFLCFLRKAAIRWVWHRGVDNVKISVRGVFFCWYNYGFASGIRHLDTNITRIRVECISPQKKNFTSWDTFTKTKM